MSPELSTALSSHIGEWTADELELYDIPHTYRCEIVDGALLVSPPPAGRHELVSEDVRSLVRAALPPGFAVVGPMGVDVNRSYFIPDLVIAERARLREVTRLAPSEVLLAVEIVSPDSVSMDRLVKPAKYAVDGIPAYWRVETEPVSLTAYRLDPGASVYTEVGNWHSGQVAQLHEPFDIQIDLASLGAP